MLPFRLLSLGCLLTTTLHAGLLAHWKLDSSTDDTTGIYDAWWRNFDGATPSYTSTVTAPYSTAAATLAGTWVEISADINLERQQPFSVSTWVKAGPQDSTIIGDMLNDQGYKGWEMHVGTTANGGKANSVTVWLVNNYPSNALQVNASTNVLDNKWHHLAFTYDGTSTAAGLKIYIDGKPASTTIGINKLTADIANSSEALLQIGSRMRGEASNFTGDIDEAALFDHALTAPEMNSVFLAGVESLAAPVMTATVPLSGQSVTSATTADVTFSLPVTGVDASDLLLNGTPAGAVQAIDSKTYRFTCPPLLQGDMVFTWSKLHGIKGLLGAPAQPVKWKALFAPVLPPGQVAIAEFLTKNAGGLEDEDHDTPDWIELWNPGTASVNLAGWALTDDPANPRAWVLPSIDLAPGERRIVFASGKNRSLASGTLHANFKLSQEGGYLALSDPSGAIMHVYDGYPRQEGNVSFGLLSAKKPSDGRLAWRYMTPTPDAAPSGTIYSTAIISDMRSTPAAPVAGDPITVTIRTSPEAFITTAPKLFYKVMQGREITVDFADDGLHGDGAADDLVWGAIIPSGATAGQMVRWRASLGTSQRWPLNTQPDAPMPLYEGTVIGGNTAGQVLPVYQIFAQEFFGGDGRIDTASGGRASFYGNGKLYDNVFIRAKGTTSLNYAKHSHRVDFNPGRDFEWSPDHEPQRELNLNSEYVDPSYLRQNQQHWMHHDSGNAGAPHFPVRLLVNGESWQLAFHTYSADSELIKVLGLDPRGALYKQVRTLSGPYGEQKSRRWDLSRSDLTALTNGLASPAAARSLYVHDNLNLPAVINYLAVARIAQESDDVWANMVLYCDTEGTKEWRPIPFDLNLSFGQLFRGFNPPYNTTVQATDDANKSHPLYGSSVCLPNTGNLGDYSRLYEAIIQQPSTRAMLLRRIRTLMDRYLTTEAATSPLEKNFDTMGALIKTDADIDRARWGLPPNSPAYGLGTPNSPAQGLATLKSSFLAVRRTHLYVTHSVNNTSKPIGIGNNDNAGIPNAQITAPVISFGTVENNPSSGNRNHQYIQLTNPGTSDAIDISDWTVRGGGGSFKMKGGTVIPAAGSLYVSPDVAAFRERAVSPKANESRFVVGPYSGHLSPYGETLRLENASGQLVAQIQLPADPNAPQIAFSVTEIMSSSAHTNNDLNGDWWELTNNGGSPLDLTGFSWDDSHNIPGQAVFPSRILAPGESLIVLNEDDDDEARLFRSAWGLPDSVQILTREDFGLEDLSGLGGADSIIVYQPGGAPVARADYPAHSSGKSRVWFSNGVAIPGDYSQLQQYGAVKSKQTPSDLGSPGFAAPDPAADPYDLWTAANNLVSSDTLPGADPDHDGRTNREEYIFGGQPRLADSPPPQAIRPASGGFEWTFTRRSDNPSVAIVLESSTDLVHWVPFSPTPAGEVPHPTLAGYRSATYLVPSDSNVKFVRARSD